MPSGRMCDWAVAEARSSTSSLPFFPFHSRLNSTSLSFCVSAVDHSRRAGVGFSSFPPLDFGEVLLFLRQGNVDRRRRSRSSRPADPLSGSDDPLGGPSTRRPLPRLSGGPKTLSSLKFLCSYETSVFLFFT